MICKGDWVKVNMPRVKRELFKGVILRKFGRCGITGRQRGIAISTEQSYTIRTIWVRFNHIKYPVNIDERHLDVVKAGPRHPLTSIFK